MRYMLLLACLAMFALPAVALDALGWGYSDETGNGLSKFHPAIYLLLIVAFVVLTTGGKRSWSLIRSSIFLPYIVCASLLVPWSVYIATHSQISNGSIGVAITSFFAPALLLISLPILSDSDVRKMGIVLRIFMVLNSLVAIGEYATQSNLFEAEIGGSFRSQGLLGHPLTSALITGILLVYLISADNRKRSNPLIATVEIALHGLAMFLYGSRTGLILVPLFLIIGALFSSGRASEGSVFRRILALTLVALGLISTQLNVPIIQSALDRFYDDQGSSGARLALFEMVRQLSWRELLFGTDYSRMLALLTRFGIYDKYGLLKALVAIENSWISLVFSFGLVFVVPLFLSLARMIYGLCRPLDHSAKLVALYFFTVTAGSVAFSSKSLLICQLIVFIVTLCQPQADFRAKQAVPRADARSFAVRNPRAGHRTGGIKSSAGPDLSV